MQKQHDPACDMKIVEWTTDGIVFEILNDDLWEGIKSGKYVAIEIGGVPYAEAA